MVEVASEIGQIKGFRSAGVHAGLKKDGALDFALIASDRRCVTAGVFTKNKVKAAPVYINMYRLETNPKEIRAVAINTVSANACTGQQGMSNAQKMAEMVAEHLECEPDQVLVMSTGVIGTQLPLEKIARGAELSAEKLGPKNWADAATAIMTTDIHPKQASVRNLTANGQYIIAGIAKGAGMIAPNMATMLSIIVTDADLTLEQTQKALKTAVDVSFNRIVVDGDTSTNDMVVLLANGSNNVRLETDYDIHEFQEHLNAVCIKLAQDVVRDGEGATKFVTISVEGAADHDSASKIAHTIASSALVKTAFYGNDANWGRILAAAGRAGVSFNMNKARLWMSPGEELFEEDRGLLLFEEGTVADYDESDATDIVSESSIYVTLDCGEGEGTAVVWTTDFSHEYVSINADYRT